MSTLRTDTLTNAAGSKSVPVNTVVDGTAKAWVNFNGSGTVAISASFNVSSITDNGVGDYTINFANALADSKFAVSCTGKRITGDTADVASFVSASDPGLANQKRIRTFASNNGGFNATDYTEVYAIFHR